MYTLCKHNNARHGTALTRLKCGKIAVLQRDALGKNYVSTLTIELRRNKKYACPALLWRVTRWEKNACPALLWRVKRWENMSVQLCFDAWRIGKNNACPALLCSTREKARDKVNWRKKIKKRPNSSINRATVKTGGSKWESKKRS